MNRLKEPSTWAGLAAIFQALSLFFPAHTLAINAATAVAGTMAVTLREGRAVPGPDNAN